jgi:hypothetical protein
MLVVIINSSLGTKCFLNDNKSLLHVHGEEEETVLLHNGGFLNTYTPKQNLIL